MSSAIFIFSGPTLGAADIQAEIEHAIVLPPASQGDVYTAARQRPWALGLIDGYFDRVPSVWHKEILWAMDRGIHVFGSASMGALRAAELKAFGMVGVGEIFRAFSAGELEDDDEVAVVHGSREAGYHAASEAMVNLRATLDAARREGIIGTDPHDALIDIAKKTFYPRRSFEHLLRQAARDPRTAACQPALKSWLPGRRVDQKRLDAVAMLREMKALRSRDPSPKQVRYAFQHSTYWDALRSSLEHRAVEVMQASHATDLPDAPIDELRLAGEELYRVERERALQRLFALNLAERSGLSLSEQVKQEVSDEFRRTHGLEDRGAAEDWIERQSLTPVSFGHLMREEARLARMRSMSEQTLPMYLVDHLKSLGRYADFAERGRHKQELLIRHGLVNPRLADAGVSDERLWSWYFEDQLGLPVPTDLEAYSRSLDLRGIEDLRRTVLRELCYRQLLAVGLDLESHRG